MVESTAVSVIIVDRGKAYLAARDEALFPRPFVGGWAGTPMAEAFAGMPIIAERDGAYRVYRSSVADLEELGSGLPEVSRLRLRDYG